MLEQIDSFGIPHNQTDRYTGQTQTARQTDTESKTDRQHTHKHVDKLSDAPGGQTRVPRIGCGSSSAAALQPDYPMRAGLADGTIGPKSLGRGKLTVHGDWTSHWPPSGRKPVSSRRNSCANVPRPGIKPRPSDLQSGALPSEILRQHAQFHHTFVSSEKRSSVRPLHHPKKKGAGQNRSQTMKLAASGGRAGGQQGRAARQGSKPRLFIVVFAARAIHVCRACPAKRCSRQTIPCITLCIVLVRKTVCPSG